MNILFNNVNYFTRRGFLDYISFEKEALFEQRFWLQILGDHARFIYNTLSSSEKEKIEKAIYFIRIFDELLEEARMSLRWKTGL